MIRLHFKYNKNCQESHNSQQFFFSLDLLLGQVVLPIGLADEIATLVAGGEAD